MDRPTRHLLLRDRRHWLGELSGLTMDADGNLTLLKVPAPADGKAIELPPPYGPDASGIAASPCGGVFVADTEHDRIVYIDGYCQSRAELPASGGAGDGPGQFRAPRGLALASDALRAADSGNGRVQSLALPALEAHLAWPAGAWPTGLATDRQGRLYVLDGAACTIRRYGRHGQPDPAYDLALQSQNRLADPRFLTIGEDDTLLVSDATLGNIPAFTPDGAFSHALSAPVAGWQPGALAAGGGRLYAADRAGGRILVFDSAGTFHGFVQGYRGPVTALALTTAGDLLIKPGLDARYFVLAADAAYCEAGRLAAGPFDAGEELDWYRAAVMAKIPPSTRLDWALVQRDQTQPPPAATDWITAPALDTLLAGLVPAVKPPRFRRQLWLRLDLATDDPHTSPTLRQVRAQTPGENWLDFLPAIYALEDRQHFLDRFLALLHTEFGMIEEDLDDMPRWFDPRHTPASALEWLAGWLAFELPRIADDTTRRELLESIVARYARRGTPESIRDFVEMHTGIRPTLVESFEERALWVLGESSRLGFDTGLPALDPNGLVVPDPEHPLGCPDERCAVTIGSAVLGASGPLAPDRLGEPLFADTAHRFCVFVPAHRVRQPALLDELCRILDREKPAHTEYRVRVVEPDFRVGFQATIGVDTVVSGPPPALRLEETRLGWTTHLADAPGDAGRVGQRSRIGQSTILE